MSNSFETFGKYTLLEKIASGGMAEVYLSNLKAAGGVNKFVGIKRILPQFSDNPEFISMFKEEAKIAINLNHSNIVSIFDFGIEKKQFYLVMEYVEGKNLRQVLNELKKQDQYFSLEQIIYISKEVAAGLDHAHRCIDGSTGKPLNITHRDMSPQNIMVSYEGEVKIIDFGIAKAETQMEATRAGTLKGKFGYMSPEQADGYPVDSRTDIFSLGIVMWELLANTRLFSGNSEPAILRKIKECQIPSLRKINPNIPVELEKIVMKALVKDKNLRYQTAAALHRDLNRFLNTQYPEFSTHDFSLFVKTTLAQYYQSQRKKMIEFATLLSGARSSASQEAQSEASPLAAKESSGFFEQLSKSLSLSGITKTELDKIEISNDSAAPQAEKNVPRMDIPKMDILTQPSLLKKAPRNTSTGELTRTSYRKNDSSSSWVLYLLILFSLGGGFYFYKQNSQRLPGSSWLSSTAAASILIESDQPETQIEVFNSKGKLESKMDSPSEQFKSKYALTTEEDYRIVFSKKGFQKEILSFPLRKEYENQFVRGYQQKNISIFYNKNDKYYKVSIKLNPEEEPSPTHNLSLQSDPAGANISINKKKLEGYTPQVVPISEEKEFSVTLSKEGFLDFQTFLSPQEKVSTLKAILLKPSEAGHINLNIPLSGTSIQIYIQAKVRNQIYTQKLNFNNAGPYEFTIPAMTPVHITATNPYNGAIGSTEVQVSPQSKNSFELFLLESR